MNLVFEIYEQISLYYYYYVKMRKNPSNFDKS